LLGGDADRFFYSQLAIRHSPKLRSNDMAVVNVMVNGRAFTIACDDGEEDHLRELAQHVDMRVKELLSSVGQVGDSRLLLMAALLITDDMLDAQSKLAKHKERLGAHHDEVDERIEQSEVVVAETLEAAAIRLEEAAAALGRAA
jgi:cell division protein ZapA